MLLKIRFCVQNRLKLNWSQNFKKKGILFMGNFVRFFRRRRQIRNFIELYL